MAYQCWYGDIFMTLREKAHRSLDELDGNALGYVYEHIQLLLQVQKVPGQTAPAPPLETVLSLTSGTSDSWGESISENREERL